MLLNQLILTKKQNCEQLKRNQTFEVAVLLRKTFRWREREREQ